MTLRCFQGRIIWNIMTESIWQVNAMLFYRLLCPVALRTIWRTSLGFICFHTTTRSSRLYTIQTLIWSMFALALRAIFIFDRIVKHITSIIHKHVCALNKLHTLLWPLSSLVDYVMVTFFLGIVCYGHFLPWHTLLWPLSSWQDYVMATFFLGKLCYGHFPPWHTLLWPLSSLAYSAMATFFLGRRCYDHFLPWHTLLWPLSSLADFAMTTFFLGILCYGHFLPWQTLL